MNCRLPTHHLGNRQTKLSRYHFEIKKLNSPWWSDKKVYQTWLLPPSAAALSISRVLHLTKATKQRQTPELHPVHE